MAPNRKLFAMVTAVLLVSSVFAPGLAAAASASAGNTTVTTGDATEVTTTSAELSGNLTALDGTDNATVYVVYYEADGNGSDAERVGETVLNETGTFGGEAEDLEPNTTYTYIAVAVVDGTEVRGEYESFTTEAETLAVETRMPADVSNESATLAGELTSFGDAEDADVSFEYWVADDPENSTTVEVGEMNETGSFTTGVSGLSNNTTYTYVATAEANGTAVTGEQVTFTAGVSDGGFEMVDGPFGQNVARFVDYLKSSGDHDERNLGQAVSEWVTENNPGADNRPDHAGPPEDRGNDDERRGPPEDKGKDKERGPPEDRGNDKDKERGPPEDRGDDEDDEADE